MANPPADKIRVICVICGEKELPKLQSNNYYWNQFLEIIGNPLAGRSQLLSEKNAACRII